MHLAWQVCTMQVCSFSCSLPLSLAKDVAASQAAKVNTAGIVAMVENTIKYCTPRLQDEIVSLGFIR